MEVDVTGWNTSKAYHVLTSIVAPRPIAWITSLNDDGSVNAAPFSWYQSICADPPMIMVAFSDRDDGRPKDTPRNIQDSGEFVVNSVTKEVAQKMVATSKGLEPGDSEVEAGGLKTEPSHLVKPPRLSAAVAHLECKFVEAKRYGHKEHGATVVIGEVVHVHIKDEYADERGSLQHDVGLLGRLGGAWYVCADGDSTFEVKPK